MNNTIEYLNKNDGSIGIDGILRANGDFPLTNANQVKGGIHHFNNIEERDAMPILKASPGMLAYVIETNIHYKLIYENDSFIWKELVDQQEIQTFFNGGEGITYNNNTGEISLTYLRSNNNVLEFSNGENWNPVIGDITSINVTTGLGLQGGASGTIGDITGNISLNHLGLENLIDPNSNSIFYWNNSTKKSEFLNIGDGLLINSGVLSNTIINNNQLINGSGYITGIDWNEIGGLQSDINLSEFTNDVGFSTFDGDYYSLTNIPTYTQGSIIFADSDGNLTEDNSQLYWDNINNRLGIGITNPTETLEVNGNIKVDGILQLFDITNTQKIELNPDGHSYITGGRLGVNTDTPSFTLDVNGDISLNANRFIRFGSALGMQKKLNNEFVLYGGSNLTEGGFNFYTWNGSSYVPNSLVIRNDGNVGIDISLPTEKLDVNGNIKASGYITGKRCGAAGYLAAPVNITVTTANTYYPIGVFTVPVAADFVVGTTYPNGLKYTGTIAQTFHITWNATIESTSNNITAIIDIEKNGTSIVMSKMGTYTKSGGELYNLSGQCVVELGLNDEVRFVVTADNNGEILTFDYFAASIKEFFD